MSRHRPRRPHRRGRPEGGAEQKDGGRIAADLRRAGAYIGVRLTHANLHNDLEALDDARA